MSEKCTVPSKEWMAAKFYRNNLVPLKERIAGTNLFLEINIIPLFKKLLKQWMSDYKFSCQNNTVFFKEWINVILSVTKTYTLLQGMDGCEITVKLEW